MLIDKNKLKAPMAYGGEAQIYDGGPNGTVMKIFEPHVNIALKKQKVGKLLPLKFPENIVAPIDEVVDSKGTWLGYSMKKVDKAETLHQYTKGKFCQIHGVSNLAILKMLIEIGQLLEKIHANNLIVGDMNDHNVIVNGTGAFFIDVDSWGVDGLAPDAYTESFVPPECYQGGRVVLNKESDNFSYNVISFNLLTKLHPFGGSYDKNPNASITERIQQHISVLGRHKKHVITPKIILPWTWMSPDLQEGLEKCFEGDKRDSLLTLLEDQAQNAKFCAVHNIYYYGKYTDCPLCTGKAQAIVKKVSTGQFVVTEIFTAADVDFFIGFDKYVTTGKALKHITSGKVITGKEFSNIGISEDGTIITFIHADKIIIIDMNGCKTAEIDRSYKSLYQLGKNTVYFINQDEQLIEMKLTRMGNLQFPVMPTHYSLFCANDKNGEMFVLSRYKQRALITLFSRNDNTLYGKKGTVIELPEIGRIDEYFIQQDDLSKRWVFVYKLQNGLFRTLMIDKTAVIYDSTAIKYTAENLSNMFFINNTVYDCGDGKIVANNLSKGVIKDFPCHVVSEDSKLKFIDGHFEIISGKTIYKLEVK